jgi:hypothetical protein
VENWRSFLDIYDLVWATHGRDGANRLGAGLSDER